MTAWPLWFVLPGIVLAFASLLRLRRAVPDVAPPSRWPPATVIVPVKGEDEGLAANLRSLASLDYPDYELIIAAQSASEIPAGVLPSGIRVVLAGPGDSITGGKIVNLIAAVSLARRNSVILAFADSDGCVSRGWLNALVAPLEQPNVGASTGYRWYAPDPPDFPSLLRAVWNGAIAGIMGPADSPFAWGGAMAIRRDLFEQLAVAERWKGHVSDDYVLSRAVQNAGLRIAYAPGATVRSADHIGFRELLSWTRRQMIITRMYHPRLWWMGLVTHLFYGAGMVASIAAGWWWALFAQLAPGMYKAARRGGWAHALLAPLATWLWISSLVSSAVSRRIEWRGKTYVLARLETR